MSNPRIKVAVLSERAGTRAGGPEIYERGLLTALLDESRSSGDIEIAVVFAWRRALDAMPAHLRHFCRVLRPEGKLGTILSAGRLVRRLQADVFHACFVIPPLLGRIPIVTTVHDLGFMRHAEHYPRLLGWRLRESLLRTVRLSDAIVVASDSAREDLLNLTAAHPGRLRKVYYGIDEQFLRPGNAEEDRLAIGKYGIKEPYILYAGKLEPRKNVPVLVEAYDRLRASGGFSGQLVMLGADRTFGWQPSQERIDRSLYRRDIIQTGYLPDGLLRPFYARASLLVFVSLFEGFGFPVVEAMACGIPVVCSNSTSLPEIAGDAALLVDPHDPDAIAGAIARAAGDEDLRRELVARGHVRAEQFTWRSAALQYLDMYRDLAKQRA